MGGLLKMSSAKTINNTPQTTTTKHKTQNRNTPKKHQKNTKKKTRKIATNTTCNKHNNTTLAHLEMSEQVRQLRQRPHDRPLPVRAAELVEHEPHAQLHVPPLRVNLPRVARRESLHRVARVVHSEHEGSHLERRRRRRRRRQGW